VREDVKLRELITGFGVKKVNRGLLRRDWISNMVA
jgi:hypothetical protein